MVRIFDRIRIGASEYRNDKLKFNVFSIYWVFSIYQVTQVKFPVKEIRVFGRKESS
jgi:hypothetical protein